MSLDVYLFVGADTRAVRKVIFVRVNGATKEVTPEEYEEMYPGREPVYALTGEDGECFHANITHNLGKMAVAAEVYQALWRPEELGIKWARDLVPHLKAGLERLVNNKRMLLPLNPENGWGNYEQLVEFVRCYLDACERHPYATVEVSR